MSKAKFTFTRVEWDALWAFLGSDFYIEDEGDEWPEDDKLFENGVSTVDPGDLAPAWQGSGQCHDSNNVERLIKRSGGLLKPSDFDRYGLVSFKTLIKRMRKRATTETIIAEIPKEAAEAVRALILKHGGRIL